jgi:hypothetical protein
VLAGEMEGASRLSWGSRLTGTHLGWGRDGPRPVRRRGAGSPAMG